MNELSLHAEVPQMIELARALKGAGGFIPEHLKTEGQILATILAGRELGLGPMASMRGLHVVKGKVGADYSLWVALLKRNGYSVEWLESSAEKVVLRLTDPKGKLHVETWDKARATTAGLWGNQGPWKNHPETMLRARAVTSAGRSFAAEVMAGGYDIDELREIDDNTPKVKATTARVVAEPPSEPSAVERVQTRFVTAPDENPLEYGGQEVVAGMLEAKTLAELEQWASRAKKLTNAEKAEARRVYSERKEILVALERADTMDEQEEDMARKEHA